jgi:hypothetical protein
MKEAFEDAKAECEGGHTTLRLESDLQLPPT